MDRAGEKLRQARERLKLTYRDVADASQQIAARRGNPNGHASVSLPVEADIDPNQTTFLSRLIRRWGKVPLSFIEGLDLQHYRYGLVGLQDWSMFPVLRPGALVLIDETQRKVVPGGWTDEFDRPIYFLEHRQGYLCGWCAMEAGNLVVLYHPASQKTPAVFRYPSEIEILGQVVGVAMLLDPKPPRNSLRSCLCSNNVNESHREKTW